MLPMPLYLQKIVTSITCNLQSCSITHTITWIEILLFSITLKRGKRPILANSDNTLLSPCKFHGFRLIDRHTAWRMDRTKGWPTEIQTMINWDRQSGIHRQKRILCKSKIHYFRQTDRQTNSQIDRKTDSKTQIDRQTDRQSQTKTIETESVRYRQTKANLIRKQNT